MQPKRNWQIQGQYQPCSDQSLAAARFVFANLRKEQKKFFKMIVHSELDFQAKMANAAKLRGETPPEQTYLAKPIMSAFALIMTDEKTVNRYWNAAASGKLKTEVGDYVQQCPFTRSYWREGIGATVCELLEGGELSMKSLD